MNYYHEDDADDFIIADQLVIGDSDNKHLVASLKVVGDRFNDRVDSDQRYTETRDRRESLVVDNVDLELYNHTDPFDVLAELERQLGRPIATH